MSLGHTVELVASAVTLVGGAVGSVRRQNIRDDETLVGIMMN